MRLNTRQKKAVKAGLDKNVLVVAGPGTGNTTVLAERHKYLTNEGEDSIRVLAFTNSAANEIGERIAPTAPSTFSSFCWRMLKGNLKRYESYELFHDETDEQQLFVKRLIGNSGLNVSRFIQLVSYCKNKGVNIEKACDKQFPYLATKKAELKALYERYEEQKEQCNKLDFDDLLTHFYSALKTNKQMLKNVVETSKHILVDEAQDLSVVQWKILKLLSKRGCRVFCVGDMAQLIYGYRGASAKRLEKFKTYFDNSKKITLVKNYRSTTEIVAVGNWLRQKINNEYVCIKPVVGEGKVPAFIQAPSFDQAMIDVTRIIISKLKLGVDINDIQLLVRTNKQLELVHNKLFEVSIPVANELDPFGIKLMTIHKSKGSESEIVFVIDPRFEYTQLDTRTAEQRILYVAITRAKKELFMVGYCNGKPLYSDSRKSDSYPFSELNNELVRFV